MRTASIASSGATGATLTTGSSVFRAQKAGWECALKSVGMDVDRARKPLLPLPAARTWLPQQVPAVHSICALPAGRGGRETPCSNAKSVRP